MSERIVMEYEEEEDSMMSWGSILLNTLGAIVCVICVAIIAGLFLGYMTLDTLELEIIERSSLRDDERLYARTILPIIQQKHPLLVTLLLMNAVAYETLPLFLDALVPSWVAILLSTTLILLFGEVLPSGLFIGPNQLYLGYRMAPVMNFFLWALRPIAYPFVTLLDYLVQEGGGDETKQGHHDEDNDHVHHHGDDDDGYHRGELSALVQIQHEKRRKKYGATNNNSNNPTTTKKKFAMAGRALTSTSTKKGESNHGGAIGGVADLENGISIPEEAQDTFPTIMTTSSSIPPTWKDVKTEMMGKVMEQQQQQQNDDGEDDASSMVEQLHPPLDDLEVDLVEGALQMKTKLAMDIYTPLRRVYALPETMVLDKAAMTRVYHEGYSRVPVYRPKTTTVTSTTSADSSSSSTSYEDRTGVLGFLMTRKLILVDWDHHREVSTMPLQRPTCVSPRMNLVQLLRLLQSGTNPIMTFVCARPDVANKALEMELPIPPEAGFLGVVTLEDIMESMIQDKIYDEGDIQERNLAVATLQTWAASKLQSMYRSTKQRRASSIMSSSPPSTTSVTTAAAAAAEATVAASMTTEDESDITAAAAAALNATSILDKTATTTITTRIITTTTRSNDSTAEGGGGRGANDGTTTEEIEASLQEEAS